MTLQLSSGSYATATAVLFRVYYFIGSSV